MNEVGSSKQLLFREKDFALNFCDGVVMVGASSMCLWNGSVGIVVVFVRNLVQIFWHLKMLSFLKFKVAQF